MAGHTSGAQQRIMKKNHNNCDNHSLNLVRVTATNQDQSLWHVVKQLKALFSPHI